MRNFCNNSIYLTKYDKCKVNDMLNLHLEQVVKYLSNKYEDLNIYLTGSLSRNEPSITIRDGDYELFSDIDFIISTPKSNPKKDELLYLTGILNKEFPTFKNSVTLVSNESIPFFQSSMGKDLRISIKKPLLESHKIQIKEDKQVTKKEWFECIVHQFSCYYLNTSNISDSTKDIHGKDLVYSYIKLILECLKAQLWDCALPFVSYHSVYMNRNIEKISNLIDSDTLESLLKSREYFGLFAPPKINLFEIITKSLLIPMDIKQKESLNVSDALYRKTVQLSKVATDLLTLFQLATTAFVLAVESHSVADEKRFYKVCFFCLKKIKDRKVTTNKTFIKNFYKISMISVSEHSKHKDLFVIILSSLRTDYLNELTFKDTGEYGFSDIQDLMVMLE